VTFTVFQDKLPYIITTVELHTLNIEKIVTPNLNFLSLRDWESSSALPLYPFGRVLVLLFLFPLHYAYLLQAITETRSYP